MIRDAKKKAPKIKKFGKKKDDVKSEDDSKKGPSPPPAKKAKSDKDPVLENRQSHACTTSPLWLKKRSPRLPV
ncbi:hypothetical protein ARMGADRAFT_1018679 [Armillaria gallica]|uniref:Uncharacterized protein n=1 Tax=Armillaria gallica TaxID=47427 RepID=A0A2H3CQV0_ARMGA|nr:hypothetical protein ARMGADRAFT_1018679 [Armillaria gallica]